MFQQLLYLVPFRGHSFEMALVVPLWSCCRRCAPMCPGLKCPNSQLLSWPKPLGLLGSWVGALAVLISTMMDLGVGSVCCM
jgi:hypothetical protein